MSVWFISLSVFVNVGRGYFKKQCDTFECANTTIAPNATEGRLDCDGYGSCSLSNISNYRNDGTQCFGSRSCQSCFKYITKTKTVAGGYLGLAYTDFVSSNSIECDGEASCHRIGQIKSCNVDATSLLSADSMFSSQQCANKTNYMRARGMFAFRNSVIYSNSNLSFVFNGFFSGYNTTIYCQSGDYCNIECDVNGCQNVNVYCMPNSNFNASLIDLSSIDFNIINNNFNCHSTCNESMAVICPNVWYNINGDYITNWNTERNKTLDAGDGYQRLLALFTNISDDYIGEMTDYKENYLYATKGECNRPDHGRSSTHCYSYYGCANDEYKLNSSEYDNVFCCGGNFGCESATFEAVGDYYDYNNYSNLYSNNIYCDGFGGCRNAKMYLNKNDKVYCRGSYGCQAADIFDFDKVYCATEKSCGGYAQIKNGQFVGCLGFHSCTNSRISSVRHIFVGGHKGVENSIITSDGTDINIYLVGRYAANKLTVECNNNDTCTMYCATYSVCENLLFFGCVVNYYDSSVNGSFNYSNHYNATLCSAKIIYLNGTYIDVVNTNQPSIYPSSYPTSEPSSEPTLSPLEKISFIFDNTTQSVQEWLLNNTQEHLSLGTKIGISIVASLELSDNYNQNFINNYHNKTLNKLANQLVLFLGSFFNVTQTNVDVAVGFINGKNENDTGTYHDSTVRLWLSHHARNDTDLEEMAMTTTTTVQVAIETTDVDIQIDTIILIDDEILTDRNNNSLTNIDYQFLNNIRNITAIVFNASYVEIQSILFNVSIVLINDGNDSEENEGTKIPFITPELVAILTMIVVAMCCILPCVWCCFAYVGKAKQTQEITEARIKFGSITSTSET